MATQLNKVVFPSGDYIENTNTDEKVKQTATSTDANYEILFSGTADNTTRTEGTRKDSYLLYNPNKHSIAHGEGVTATGLCSCALGRYTTASHTAAHTEGQLTTASGYGSHAEGWGTIANHKSQHVFGEYNIADPSIAESVEKGTYIEIVGNGTGASNVTYPSNARTLDWDGNEWLAGGLTLNNNEILIGDRYIGGNLNGTGLFINNYYDSDWDATYDLELQHRYIYQEEENSTAGFTNRNQIFPGIIQQELSLSSGSKVTSDIRPVSISLEAYSSSSSSSPDSKIFINSSDISLSGTNNSWDGTNTSLKDAISSKLNRTGDKLQTIVDQTNFESDSTSYGINMNNSSLVNVNAINFNDTSDYNSEAINFKRSNGNWDSLLALNGVLKFITNRTNGGNDGTTNNIAFCAGSIRIAAGTKVITLPAAQKYVQIFTNAELNTALGISSGAGQGSTVVYGMNGDYGAQGKYLSGAVYQNGNWFLQTNDGTNLNKGAIRINYIIVKFA